MNLVKNGSFSEYTFAAGKDWGTGNRGVKSAGRWNGDQFIGLGSWTWGKYTGNGKKEFPAEAQDAVDLINGAADGHFPEDAEHPFASSENLIDVNGNATLGFIEQSVPVVPGRHYELSFYHGYNIWPGHDVNRPTYLRVEIEAGGRVVTRDDYIQYYSGKGGKASHSDDQVNRPDWRRRRVAFTVPAGEPHITVRFANPGRHGLDPELGADSDGHSGMQLAHIRLAEATGAGTLATVTQGNEVRAEPGRQWVYPAFVVRNSGERTIGTVQVVLRAPEPMRFMEDRLAFVRQDDESRERIAPGIRSADGRTLTCNAVELELEQGEWASLYPAMEVAGSAEPGPAQVGIELGSPAFATGRAAVVVVAP